MEIEDMNQWINRVRGVLAGLGRGRHGFGPRRPNGDGGSQYFKDWTFYSSSANGTGHASIAGQAGADSLDRADNRWQLDRRADLDIECPGDVSGSQVPSRHRFADGGERPLFEHLASRAANPSLLEIATSNGQPLPIGTVLFLHDVDGGDHAQLRFLVATAPSWMPAARNGSRLR
jgi:hypothetical protein